ncbi:hypothetical protein E2C01_075798 [Portunus trituberculatus]|uniref:Uncharacterized protein n=1 Tax=Portunus trituberculatus TaxID=210409 RepID=A0A5B7IBK5_PORTR|nr:hypothetical protein [Portunus trituberculatus]
MPSYDAFSLFRCRPFRVDFPALPHSFQTFPLLPSLAQLCPKPPPITHNSSRALSSFHEHSPVTTRSL